MKVIHTKDGRILYKDDRGHWLKKGSDVRDPDKEDQIAKQKEIADQLNGYPEEPKSKWGAKNVWWSRLDQLECKAIESYQNSSVAINGQLRSGNLTSAVRSKVRLIEGAIDKSITKRPIKVHRTTSGAAFGLTEKPTVENLSVLIGQTFKEKGFTSTSVFDMIFSDRVARKGMGTSKNNFIQCHIGVPAGKGIIGRSVWGAEYILNRGAKTKLIGVYEKDGIIHCNLIWVGRDPDDLGGRKSR